MTKKIVLVAAPLSQESILIIKSQPHLEVIFTEGRLQDYKELENVSAVVVRSQSLLDSAFFTKAKKLQLVVTATVGFDHIDLLAAEKWGVTVMHTPKAHSDSACQLTWALLLAALYKIPLVHKSVKAGEWDRTRFRTHELRGQTLGVVGLGRIGRKVAQIAQTFGMQVISYDPYVDDSFFEILKVERVSYEELLKQSDVVTFHVPKTQETQHMLNRSHLEYIHRGALVINTSRGSVINEEDLCEALEKGWVAGCGLDVFEKEPLPRTSRLLNSEKVVLSPHLGSQTQEAFERASEEAVEKLIRFFMDGATSDTLPPKEVWYSQSLNPRFKN
jgi:D-3-phosphoglycerate dehydrogenase